MKKTKEEKAQKERRRKKKRGEEGAHLEIEVKGYWIVIGTRSGADLMREEDESGSRSHPMESNEALSTSNP